jgi:serine protease Do
MIRTMILGAVILSWTAGPVVAQSGGNSSQPPKSLADFSAAMENLARSASPAVVQIRVHTLAPVEKGEGQALGFVSEEEATGSGVIVDPDGYIVTNAHVVRHARRIEVKILRNDERASEPHGHLLPAQLIGLDREVDIAVVKIEAQHLPALSFVNSDTLRQGQLVLAVGSPLGLQNSLTHGVISATARQLLPESPMVYIQTDAPINPGNSGGPLLDIEGRIAGINTMIFTQSGGNEGIGFAIPANLAQDVYQRLRKDGRIRRGAIGVIPETITPQLGAALGLDRDAGVILSDVSPHSAAEAAGLQTGDVVLSVDGKPMRTASDLVLAIFQRSPGDDVKLEILRGKERMSITVAVLDRKSAPGQLEDLVNYDTALVRRLGILALTVDERVNAIMPNLRRLSGVAVAAVPEEYAGLNPGLLAGDVIYELNTQPVPTLEDLRKALNSKKRGDPIVLLVERLSQLIYVTAEME